MSRAIFGCFALIAMLLYYPVLATAQQDAELQKQLEKVIEDTLEANPLPGIVAAIIVDGKMVASHAVGLRSIAEKDNPIKTDDKLHIGSCTKAMTATLIGILVDEGTLSWDDTIKQHLPKIAEKIDSSFHEVTLWELLTHRSGFPVNGAFFRGNGVATFKNQTGILKYALKKPNETWKRGDFEYSNLGYLAASMFADAATDSTYEELLQEKLFTPLKMESAGFGPPGVKSPAEQPWGHTFGEGKFNPCKFDNPASMNAAGRVHCSAADWGKFGALHADTECKSHSLLKPETLAKLHGEGAEVGQEYAGGWLVAKNANAGLQLDHSGSNTYWFSSIRVLPERNLILLVSGNAPIEKATLPVLGVIEIMTEKVLEERD